MTENKIPKGFIKHLELNLDMDYGSTDWIKQNEILVLPKSIYDKRLYIFLKKYQKEWDSGNPLSASELEILLHKIFVLGGFDDE